MGRTVSAARPRLSTVLTDTCRRSKNVPVVSKDLNVFVVLVGRPDDESYVSDLKLLEGEMEKARDTLRFPKGSMEHRRGHYPNVSTGISYGGGSKVSKL